MRTFLTLAFVALLAVFVWTQWAAPRASESEETYAADVKVLLGKGHGSGVHIGRGYILTAAHVAKNKDDLRIKSSIGSIHDVELLWRNEAYDVALLRIKGGDMFDKASLSCRVPKRGERIVAVGNPVAMDGIVARGRVAGAEREAPGRKSVVPVDLTIISGMSGGAVYDQDHSVVGLAVGFLRIRGGGMMASWTGLGVIVPGSAICNLLARA